MHYFLLPLIPLTIAGAIFFKSRIAAYGFPIVLTLIKIATTKVSLVYLFTALGLWAVVYLTRKLNSREKIFIPYVAMTAALGVLVYSLISNFGVWLISGCVPGDKLYAFNVSGLLACYKAAIPHAGVHFLKAVPLTLVLVQVLDWARRWNVAVNLQRFISNKAS